MMFPASIPQPNKKRKSIPNMAKRGSNASGSGVYGLVITPTSIKVNAYTYLEGQNKKTYQKC
jgi:hypothetical protein